MKGSVSGVESRSAAVPGAKPAQLSLFVNPIYPKVHYAGFTQGSNSEGKKKLWCREQSVQ